MDALEASAIIAGSAKLPPTELPGRARHPRTKSERTLLDELQASIDNATKIASSTGNYDALRSRAMRHDPASSPPSSQSSPSRDTHRSKSSTASSGSRKCVGSDGLGGSGGASGFQRSECWISRASPS